MSTPIDVQINEVRRELSERRDRYAREIRHNLITATEAESRNTALMSVLATLAVIERNAEPLRLLILALRRTQQDQLPPQDELDALLAHQGVRNLMSTFPDGVLVSVTKPTPAVAESDHTETEPST